MPENQDLLQRIAALESELEDARKSKDYLSQLIEKSSDGTFVCSLDGRILECNEVALRLLGYQEHELVGQSVYELVTDANQRKSPIRIDLVLEKGALQRERIYRHSSGKEVPALATAVRINDESFMVTIRSLEAERAARKALGSQTRALEESQDTLEALIASIPGAIYRSELRDKWSIIYLSDYFHDLTGFKPSDFVLEKRFEFNSIVHPDDMPKVRRVVDAALESLGSWAVDYRLKCADGSERWVTDHGRVRADKDGNARWVDGVVLDYQDVMASEKERDRLAADLRHAQKMETVGRLAGGIAHDFNNLLSPIIGIAELTMNKIEQEHPHYRRFENIHSAAMKAAELTKRMLAFSQKQELKMRTVDLGKEINNNLGLLRRLMREDVELCVEMPELPVFVSLDRVQLSQVLMNLCVNAVDAIDVYENSKIHGRIDLRLEQVFLDESNDVGLAPGDWALLHVEDNGSGMSDLTAMQVFDPFFTTKGAGKGTGLGLATTYGIVEQHGGMIDLSSELGVGTSFAIYLPISESRPTTNRDSQRLANVSVTREELILVVEDDPMVRDVISHILLEAGFRVLLARDGNEALDIAEDRAEDLSLLLTDVVMPGMNGSELFRRMQNIVDDLPALFVSGYAGNVLRDALQGKARTNFLAKPFSPESLISSIEGLLDG